MSKEEFKYIYDQYFDVIRNYIYYRSGNAELATDIAQETFIKVWEKQFEYKEGQIKALLYKIASDYFINHLRHKKITEENITELKFRMIDSNAEDEEMDVLKVKYEKALAKLPEKQRIVFLMNKMGNYTYKEISDDLNLSVKAIEKRMSKAIKMLKDELRK